jgi:hypothetical protein
MNPWQWIKNLFKVEDVALDTVVLCDPKVETFSRRAAQARADGKRWGCVVCAVLDWFVVNHCADALKAGEIE